MFKAYIYHFTKEQPGDKIPKGWLPKKGEKTRGKSQEDHRAKMPRVPQKDKVPKALLNSKLSRPIGT